MEGELSPEGSQTRSAPETRKGRPVSASTLLSAAALALAIIALIAVFVLPRPVPAASTQPQAWANVAANGTMISGHGVLRVQHSNPGFYVITFTQAVANCSVVATPWGYPPGQLLADPYFSQPGDLNLYIESAVGGAPTNSSFSVVEYCVAVYY